MQMDAVIIDGKTYVEIDKILIKEKEYVYLVNKDNENDFLVRKLGARDGKVFYDGLDDKEEFDIAMVYFVKKHENILTDEDSEF